jgi:hypothetical protein
MTRSALRATALWFLLAIIVFSVRFDWQARMAGHEFVRLQILRQQQDLPVHTINDGFRPMVRDAAIDASRFLVLIASAGALLAYAADRRQQNSA